MREFFRPWRRKIGVLTLVLACLSLVVWVRSLMIADALIFPARQKTTDSLTLITFDTLFSTKNAVVWIRDHEESTENINEPIDLGHRYPIWKTSEAVSEFDDGRTKWRWRWCGFGIGRYDEPRDEGVWETFMTIPYWSIVIPLTALSCFLLIPKPNTSTQTKPALPIQDEGEGAAT